MGISNPSTDGWAPSGLDFSRCLWTPTQGVRPRTCGSSLGMKREVRRYLRKPSRCRPATEISRTSHIRRYLLKHEGSTDLSHSLCTFPLWKSKYLNTFTVSLSTLPPVKSKFHCRTIKLESQVMNMNYSAFTCIICEVTQNEFSS